MEHILLPTTIDFVESDDVNSGKVIITPCHQGYGTTMGNALRRVLLSSLPGAAVETVKIDNVQHEFSAKHGVQEDVVEIILNLKQVSVRCFSDYPVTLSVTKKGKGVLTAGDFSKNADVDIVNPDLVIANLTSADSELTMEITIGKGRGYVSAAEKNSKDFDLGTIAIDSLYTPIRDVGYEIENTRVGDVTDYEKLTLKVVTNGTISPRDAVSQATKILMDHFSLLLNMAGTSEERPPAQTAEEVTEMDESVPPEEENTGDEEATPVKKKSKKSK